VITRKPELEKWDAEDDSAWYRVREDGAVFIYNQGVLVRDDPGHNWGVGGIIVSKKALALNVSRTEILRKSCMVWKQIAAKFSELAQAFSDNTGSHRKTEARREKTARALLAGEGDLQKLFNGEEVITLLPGKQHVTFEHFLRKCWQSRYSEDRHCFTLAEVADDVPRGELIARAGIATVVHPVTLTRFGCHSQDDFMECMSRVRDNLLAFREQLPPDGRWGHHFSRELQLIDFDTLSAQFINRMQMVSETALDKETRRAWTALRFCLAQYARLCAGGEMWSTTRARGGVRFQIFLGESTSADAWTDGETYIAYNIDIVRQLRTDALRTASRLFSLTEHEVAHEGDSLDCGHDEGFYQRFHDISTACAAHRQHFMHVWLMKYTISLEGAGKRAKGRVWQERYLTERASTGRVNNGLPDVIPRESLSEAINTPVEPEVGHRLAFLNQQLGVSGTYAPDSVNWADVVAKGIEEARLARDQRAEDIRMWEAEWETYQESPAFRQLVKDQAASLAESERQDRILIERYRSSLLETLPGATTDNLTDDILSYLYEETFGPEEEMDAWLRRTWEQPGEYRPLTVANDSASDVQKPAARQEDSIPESWLPYVHEGETRQMIERNADAAGFVWGQLEYLKWRHSNDTGGQE
ncbi:MAG: ATP-binding protein, partial [Pantoea agglomerans]